jgi:hypothetical protein
MGSPQATPKGSARDAAEALADVLAAKRDVLLRVHRHRLPHEDLEDCLSQAALELVGRARAGALADERHIANALEQKFLSRITDRQSAHAGRSAIAAATHDAVRLGHVDDDGDAALEISTLDGEPSDAISSREDLQRCAKSRPN